MIRALLIEPNVVDASLISGALEDSTEPRIELTTARCLVEGLERLGRGGYDVVLVDLSIPSGSDTRTVERIREVAPDVPCVALAAVTDEELAIQSLHQGAQDYLIKDGPYFALLTRAIRYAIDRMRAENALRERERYFQLVIENVSDIIVVLDVEMTVRYISPAIERVCAIQQTDLIGRVITGIVHPEDVPIVQERAASRMRGEGDPGTYTEVRVRHAMGGWRWLQLRGKLYDDPSGESVLVVAGRDITENRRLEELLQQVGEPGGICLPRRQTPS